MGDSSIQWTDKTFNPWLGCAKAHAGCTHCYAEGHQAVAMRKGGRVQWGEVWLGGQRVVVADSTWKKPHAWAREAAREGKRLRVFCASLADVLEVPVIPEEWPRAWSGKERQEAEWKVVQAQHALDEARTRLWDTIRETAAIGADAMRTPQDATSAVRNWPGLDWLLLTKRPENWILVPEDVRPLVWLGTSVSDQKTADEWVPRLQEAEGFRYRFLSLEPMLGPVDLGRALGQWHEVGCGTDTIDGSCACQASERVDWVIVGGESGPRARPCEARWIRDVVHQCKDAGVPVFVKQWGSAPRIEINTPTGGGFRLPVLRDSKGGDWSEWPETLRVRKFPGEGRE